MIGMRPYRSAQTPQKGTKGRPKRKNAAFRYPVQAGTSGGGTCTVPRYRGKKRKTCETENASMVDVIPKRTRSTIHPDALRVDAAWPTSINNIQLAARATPYIPLRSSGTNTP